MTVRRSSDFVAAPDPQVAAAFANTITNEFIEQNMEARWQMSQRTGISVETLSELGYAAQLSGVDVETLETAIKRMQKTIIGAAEGSQAAVEALAELGLTVEDLRGLSPDQQFKLRMHGDAGHGARRGCAHVARFRRREDPPARRTGAGSPRRLRLNL